jgi:hypothetical protein
VRLLPPLALRAALTPADASPGAEHGPRGVRARAPGLSARAPPRVRASVLTGAGADEACSGTVLEMRRGQTALTPFHVVEQLLLRDEIELV